MPISGSRLFPAITVRSASFQAAWSPSEPDMTVKSIENSMTGRPLTFPKPMITPSRGLGLALPS